MVFRGVSAAHATGGWNSKCFLEMKGRDANCSANQVHTSSQIQHSTIGKHSTAQHSTAQHSTAWHAHLPKEEPLAIVEEGDDSSNDNGPLHILGHVLEDWCQEEQHKHDHQGTDDSCQLGFGTASVHDGRTGEGTSGGVAVESSAKQVGDSKTSQLLGGAAPSK